jgi:hypothetical protein
VKHAFERLNEVVHGDHERLLLDRFWRQPGSSLVAGDGVTDFEIVSDTACKCLEDQRFSILPGGFGIFRHKSRVEPDQHRREIDGRGGQCPGIPRGRVQA